MKIDFKKVEIHNFLSFSDEIFDFEAYPGMNLVTGVNFDIPNSRNGAGKSSVFYSLLYGLYGQLPNKIKTENISNRYVDDKEVRVVVYLSVDGVSYKAISGLNKRGGSYFNLIKVSNGEEVDLTKSSIAETRDLFENQILHCDISLFLRTILLTSEQNYNFFSLKKQDKKDFIEKLFDIGLFGDMYDLIHKDSIQLEKTLMSYQNHLVVLNSNVDDYQQRSIQFVNDTEDKKQQVSSKIELLSQKLKELKSKVIVKNTELIQKYQEVKSKLGTAKQKLSDSVQSSKIEIQREISELKALEDANSLKQRELNKHSDLLQKLCSDCQQIFLKYHNLESYRGDIEDNQKKIFAKKTEIEQKKAKRQELTSKISQIDEKTGKAEQKIEDLNREYDQSVLQQQQIEKQIGILQFNLDELEKKMNPYLELISSTQASIEKETEKLNQAELDEKYLKKAESIVSQDSLRKFIIKDLIGIINNKIKYYLMKMGSKYTCIFDESLDYQFITESGPCELYNFSCGEKKRLEIATCLSFRDFIAQRSNIVSNILILDEYIDSGIDTLAVESILSILKEFTRNYKQNIFIISHRSEVNNDVFDNIIEIQKKGGISKVELT